MSTTSAISLNRSAVGRIAWKELRTQRMLMVIVLVAGVLMQIFFDLFVQSSDNNRLLIRFLDSEVIGVFALLFAAVSGVLLFSGERDNGTDSYLRTLPIAPRELLLGKLLGVMPLILLFVLFTGR